MSIYIFGGWALLDFAYLKNILILKNALDSAFDFE